MMHPERPPEPASFQAAQLGQLIRLLVPVAFGFTVLSVISAAVFRDARLGVTGGLIFIFGCLVLIARAQLRGGTWERAVTTICVSILGTTLAVVIVQPDWFPTLAVTPLITVMIALPYTEDRVLRPLLYGAWLVTFVVVLVGRVNPLPSGLPFWVQSVFLISSLAAAVATVLLLLWQFRSRLTRTLSRTRAAEERYALAVRATNDGIWDWNLNTDRVYFSPRWKEMLGWKESEIGDSASEWLERIHPEDREQVEARLQIHLDGKSSNFEIEHRVLHKDGYYLWMLAQGVAARNGSGEAVRIAGSQSNIDERKHAEEELKKRATQLTSYNAELEQFAYSVSHDLRAPLRWITGFSKVLLEDHTEKLDEEGKDYLGRILEASDSMGERVDSLLGIARLTRRKLERETIDLSSIVEGIAEELQKSHPNHGTEFVITKNLSASVDEQLIRIVVENLLDNAWKFTRKEPRPRIEFGMEENDGEHVFFVRDNGAGFDETYADNLFGPFQRLHEPEEFDGTGLGLATVQRIIHRHGGQVWAEGVEGEGATFYFTL